MLDAWYDNSKKPTKELYYNAELVQGDIIAGGRAGAKWRVKEKMMKPSRHCF